MDSIRPDEALSIELRNRSLEYSWDGEPIWDARWIPGRKSMAVVQRRKPEPGHPTGRWTIWNLLFSDDGKPRNIERRDINLLLDHVYGGRGRPDDWQWFKDLESEEFRQRVELPEVEMDDGIDQETKFVKTFDTPKIMMGQGSNKRYGHAQRACSHGEWMVECKVCSPEERKVFLMGSKSGESNVRTERGKRGSP